MTSDELLETVEDYNVYYLSSELRLGVHFGCDCGCGGDSYTSKQWDEMVEESEEAYNNFRDMCIYLGVAFDG